ncbi:membrane protein [Rhodococcus erythropolis]|nr:membrane protein [Rhodococcus erythropolis]
MSSSTAEHAEDMSGTIDEHRSREMTIGLAVLGVFVTYVPITAVAVALTTIGNATGASTSDLQWVSDSYVIPMAAAVLSAGVFGDLYGRRRIYLIGMLLTILGAAIAGVAGTLADVSTIHLLWAGQAVSGLGAGMLLPTTLALIGHAVPNPRERGKFIGIWATGMMLGLALGPLVAGGILEFAEWGWIFAPTAVLAAGAGVFAIAKLPESQSPEGRHLDWPGQISATIAIASSIYGIIEGGASGWTSPHAIIGLGVAGVAFATFVIIELRATTPLMNLALFRSPTFSAAGFSASIALFSIVGSMFLLSLFLGSVQQLSPLEIGWRLLFVTGVGALINPLVGLTMHRFNAMTLLAGGLALAAVGMLLLTVVDESTGFVDLAWRLAIYGISVAVMMTSVSTAAINAVPWHLAGMAAAANTAMRQYGGALGPAVLGAVFAIRVNGGANPAGAFHTALILTAVLLAIAAIGCLVASRSSANPTNHL